MCIRDSACRSLVCGPSSDPQRDAPRGAANTACFGATTQYEVDSSGVPFGRFTAEPRLRREMPRECGVFDGSRRGAVDSGRERRSCEYARDRVSSGGAIRRAIEPAATVDVENAATALLLAERGGEL